MTDAEISSLVVGALIESPGRTVRVVRAVHHYAGGRAFAFCAIRHCSWTRRCYTLLDRPILREYRLLSNKPRALRGALDRRIGAAIHSRDRGAMTCCDVEGVP